MPKRKAPSKNWFKLTKKFVKEWPEVLDEVHLESLPISYLTAIVMNLKNNIAIRYDIENELKKKTALEVARTCVKHIETHYKNITKVDLKFNVPKLKKDITKRTDTVLDKVFKK